MALWKGKSCDKLNYDTARRRILRSLDVPDCVWRHLCASPAVKSVKIFYKTVVFYLFEALTCGKKNLKWIFFFHMVIMKLVICFISIARGHKTHKLFLKYRTYISDLFEFQSSHNYHVRSVSNNNMLIKRHNSKIFEKSLQYVGPRLWNSLPQAIKDSPSLPSFKTAISKFLASKRIT